ncbi:hypothetical protein HWV00_21045 (plasmid) [Moritella sp. 24]|uniref:hypothetical protein n=1 Tax=Moritella sp. 24 TaxID=2746230 RepID=UPI001BA65D08|nr:hypothetical protein [Moritella sp. 24]QUM78762.1 hypothetical protein HWV00_21045 [Moritella sp. 24]
MPIKPKELQLSDMVQKYRLEDGEMVRTSDIAPDVYCLVEDANLLIEPLLNEPDNKVWKSGDECIYDCISGTLIIERRGWFFKPHGMMRVFEVTQDRILKC